MILTHCFRVGVLLFPLLATSSASARAITPLDAETLIAERHAHRAALLLRRDMSDSDPALRQVWESLPATDRAWAEAVYTGAPWSSPRVEELGQRVTAIAIAFSEAVVCHAPVSVLASSDDDANSAPFQEAQHHLGAIRCHSEVACGDGPPPVLVFVVQQADAGRYELVGHFDEIPSPSGSDGRPDRQMRVHNDELVFEVTTRDFRDTYDATQRVWCDRTRRACASVDVAYRDEYALQVTFGSVVRAELIGIHGAPSAPVPRLDTANGRWHTEPRLLHGGIELAEFFGPPSGQGGHLTAPSEGGEVCLERVIDPSGSQNVRVRPSANAPIVTALTTGTAVDVAERQGSWSRITSPVEGWLFQTANVCIVPPPRRRARTTAPPTP